MDVRQKVAEPPPSCSQARAADTRVVRQAVHTALGSYVKLTRESHAGTAAMVAIGVGVSINDMLAISKTQNRESRQAAADRQARCRTRAKWGALWWESKTVFDCWNAQWLEAAGGTGADPARKTAPDDLPFITFDELRSIFGATGP